MGGWSQTVAYGPGAALGLHVAACMPNLSQPYDMVGPMAWQDDLTNEPFEFANGAFRVPDRPGLGFTLNRDAAHKYPRARESLSTMSNVYEALGVPTVINAVGPSTRLSGGIMRPEVAEAMAAASQHCVDIAQLQARASQVIAKYTGAEAGYVTSGAAAGLPKAWRPASRGWTRVR